MTSDNTSNRDAFGQCRRRSRLARLAWLCPTLLMLGVLVAVLWPPESTGSQARRICHKHLQKIHEACKAYRAAHAGGDPADLAALVEAECIDDPDTLICPVAEETRLPYGTGTDAWTQCVREGTHVSYVVVGDAATRGDHGALIREKAANHVRGGSPAFHVLFRDGRIELMTPAELNSAMK